MRQSSDRFVAPDGAPLDVAGCRSINCRLELRDAIYRTLIDDRLLARYQIDPLTFINPLGETVVKIDASPRIGTVEIKIWRQLSDRDPVVYFQLADTANDQIDRAAVRCHRSGITALRRRSRLGR